MRIKKKPAGKLIGLCVLLLAMLQLAGCGSTKLAEGFDEEVIKETAEEIINQIQLRGAKEVLTERMREDFVGNIDLDTMEETVKDLDKASGNFISYTEETVVGKYHPEAKEDFGVVLVTAAYDDGEINYTITFDKDMNVVGFYAQ